MAQTPTEPAKSGRFNVLLRFAPNIIHPNSPQLTSAIQKSGVRTVHGSDAHRTSEIRKV